MKIKPNASSDELSSPFFLLNEKFCSDFEKFVAGKKGKVKGRYNAWSYSVFGKISTVREWDLAYEKATFTSTGNLFLSSKYQTLRVLLKWETNIKDITNSEFVIRKKKRIDYFKIWINKPISLFSFSEKYVLELKNKEPTFMSLLIKVLKPLFETEELYRVEYNNNRLKIEMRTERHHFVIFDRLISELEKTQKETY